MRKKRVSGAFFASRFEGLLCARTVRTCLVCWNCSNWSLTNGRGRLSIAIVGFSVASETAGAANRLLSSTFLQERKAWPYDDLFSDPSVPGKRTRVSGTLSITDRFDSKVNADGAYVGMVAPGKGPNWWQDEVKGYQFWCRAEPSGKLSICGCKCPYEMLVCSGYRNMQDHMRRRGLLLRQGMRTS